MRKFILILLIIIPVFSFSQLNTNHVIHTGRGRLYFGNYTGAIESFNMVIRIKPYLPEPYFYRGVAKMNLEDYRGAMKDLNKAIEIKPFYPDAILYRGIVNYDLGNYDEAMKDYSTVLKFDEENANLFNNRGICKAAMRDFEGAIEDYSMSIELKPKNFNAYLNRSIAYQIIEKWDKSISDCNQLIRIRPNSPMGYMSRGLVKIEKKDFASALRDFDIAIYLDPKNAFAYQNRGMVKQQLESYEAAIMDYSQAISINNRLAGAYFNRGIAKEMTGKEGYQNDYDRAAILDPRYAKRPWQTDEEKEKMRQQKQQIAAIQQQKSKKSNKNQTHALSDTIQDTQDNTQNNQIDISELRKRKMKANLVVEDTRNVPGNKYADSGKIQNNTIQIALLPLFEISAIYKDEADNEDVGYFDMNIENLNAANNYNPYLTLTNNPIINIDTEEKFLNQELTFDERIKLNDSVSNNYLYRGIFRSLTGNYKGAITDFDKSIELNERNLLAYFMRANTKSKIIELVNEINNQASISTAKHDFSYDNILKESDEETDIAIKEILTDYSVVLYMNPNFSFCYYNRGNMYCKSQKFLSAIDEYDKAISLYSDFAEAYYNRGLVRILLNDVEGGAKDLSKAGELGIAESYNVIKRYCN